MNIYILCPDTNSPFGGIKQLYRHADILNKNGFSAYILHEQKGFRCTWFKNNTEVTYITDVRIEETDYLVIPENYGPYLANIGRGIIKIIFNQGCYNTFKGYSINIFDYTTPYNDEEVIATMVVSEDSYNYLQYVFPNMSIFRIHNGIDQALFKYQSKKKKLIAYMQNKSPQDFIQVINILKFRGIFDGYELAPINNKTQAEVAAIMKESLMFLSFGYQEGFSLPPAEAMSCGCIVVGYHGNGGKEFFQPEFSYPIPQGDIITFVKTIEEVLRINDTQPDIIKAKSKQAATFIKNNYSLKIEEQDIVTFWKTIIKRGCCKIKRT